MILARIRGTREELRSLEQSPIFLQRRGLRRLGGGRFEVPAVVEPTELSLLQIKGYNVIVVGEAKTLLRQRLRAHTNVSTYQSDDDFFASVASNQGYMAVDYIETWMANLVDIFPLLVELVPMPNPTWEGRQSTAVRLGAGSEGNRPAVVFISGVHAGELGGPDACIYFLYRLIDAYRNRAAVTLGKYTVSAQNVQGLLNSIDIYVYPCVNPDGRQYVFNSLEWWRKNRNPHVGMGAVGVDINRNYDFLWSSGIGSSMLPQDETYRGPAPLSEPETRNVGWLVKEAAPNYFVDIHGPSGTLVYVWGDAQDQSVSPSMNFQNAAWDGRRYTPYGEYLSAADAGYVQQLGARVATAVNAVEQSNFDSEPSFSDLYPTSATSDDYAFSRHLVDPTAGKTYAYTFEYSGGEFFPAYDELQPIVAETNAGMLEFCMAAMGSQTVKVSSD